MCCSFCSKAASLPFQMWQKHACACACLPGPAPLCALVLRELFAALTSVCPTHRTVPKFMKRSKVPDYRDKMVFGVPPIVNVQRTGQPLPQSIQQAMRYLRSQCLDQVMPPLHRIAVIWGKKTSFQGSFLFTSRGTWLW